METRGSGSHDPGESGVFEPGCEWVFHTQPSLNRVNLPNHLTLWAFD